MIVCDRNHEHTKNVETVRILYGGLPKCPKDGYKTLFTQDLCEDCRKEIGEDIRKLREKYTCL